MKDPTEQLNTRMPISFINKINSLKKNITVNHHQKTTQSLIIQLGIASLKCQINDIIYQNKEKTQEQIQEQIQDYISRLEGEIKLIRKEGTLDYIKGITNLK